ncbi:pseudouridine synthase [Selenomonas sp. TAMA-11512]|uniref:pseudouridine synthase n=1 Tax=Selenomonas sp. TAMA-11512 TaxID=3095337 RepID=UPI0030848A6C|nr:pseudouridine synthase [Selenomonas sp. TAMA-11512]
MEERLQKILAQAGVASRRSAEELILAGRVSVDGQIIRTLGTKHDARRVKIKVDGKPIRRVEEKLYFLLNKPKGYVSTVSDEHGRRTVMDLLPDVQVRVYPIGRLDVNTEGLLLLTNDGELTNRLLHPGRMVAKTYRARVSGALDALKLKELRRGVRLDDRLTAPAEVRVLGVTDKGLTEVEIVIHEGRNRQVRRMMEAVGCDVKSLKRTRFAELTLQGVRRGQYRALTQTEIERLYELSER